MQQMAKAIDEMGVKMSESFKGFTGLTGLLESPLPTWQPGYWNFIQPATGTSNLPVWPALAANDGAWKYGPGYRPGDPNYYVPGDVKKIEWRPFKDILPGGHWEQVPGAPEGTLRYADEIPAEDPDEEAEIIPMPEPKPKQRKPAPRYDILLDDAGDSKIRTIKAVIALHKSKPISVKDAKALVDRASRRSVTVKENVAGFVANRMVKELQAAGAKARAVRRTEPAKPARKPQPPKPKAEDFIDDLFELSGKIDAIHATLEKVKDSEVIGPRNGNAETFTLNRLLGLIEDAQSYASDLVLEVEDLCES